MTAKEKELVQRLIAFLDCPCQVFESMEDDDPIQEAYEDARRRGREQGFTPLLLGAEDMLLEDMLYNCGAENQSGADTGMEKIRQWRKELLEASSSGDFSEKHLEWLYKGLERLKSDPHACQEAMDETAEGELVEGFSAYWDLSTMDTRPVILAEIPVELPWQVFAWLSIGGWNEMPGPEGLMAISKRWYEKYGAVPAAAIHDILEYSLDQPVSDRKEAGQLAMEQYLFCVDRVEQAAKGENLGTLADSLSKSNRWFFWWD